jgi:hypothetical protein
MFHVKIQVDALCMFQENTWKSTFHPTFQSFQPKHTDRLCISYSDDRSESLAIACSVIHHQLCASGFPHSKIILDYFPLVETFILMRGTFPPEEFLFGTKLREIPWKLAFDLATSTSWVVIGAKKACYMADHGGYKFIAYPRHILPHILNLRNNSWCPHMIVP